MSEPLADLFPGFEARTVTGDGAEIFLRTGGDGPPLLLVHGYPQTHVMWHRVAPALAEHFTLVIPDLRGYGQSSVPATVPDHATYSKRAMARDLVAVMAALGHDRFHLAGHDRGGRVSYRLALDHPQVLDRLAVLDIVPTHAMWHEFTVAMAMKVYHWLFLAQPKPLPEMLITKAPADYLDYTIASWTKANSLEAFDPRAMAHYRASFSQSDRIHACCEDYRAGQTCDLAADEADVAAGRKIAAPLLALWGSAGIPGETRGPLDIWRDWADEVTGIGIDSGHFACEENPDAATKALLDFFRGGS
ncbi:alpha/beta fold hydrolase [Microbaculum sp. FT89]|uniref:alpha/beta fold hydrolase n=1 Tax=Microbaculum sp. FT89 TaxID=3447298 RepID=UPI003F536563